MIVYVDDVLVTCKDEVTIDGVIETIKTKYDDVQLHMKVKHSYLGMPLDLSVTWVSSITTPVFIADILKKAIHDQRD